jgi:hypothetical protein
MVGVGITEALRGRRSNLSGEKQAGNRQRCWRGSDVNADAVEELVKSGFWLPSS